MNKLKIKSKKSMEGGMWWIVVGAIVAAVIAMFILFIVRGGLSAADQSIDLLGSCKNKDGICKESKEACGSDDTVFFNIGCPFDENADGKIDDTEKKNKYCCVPKE